MGLYDRDYAQESRLSGTFTSRVYGWMTAGLAITTFVSLGLYFSGLYRVLFSLWWIWCIATLGVSFYINSKIHKLSVPAVMGLFLTYSALEGLFFGTLVPVYALQYGGNVVWAAFGSAGLIFGIAAAYGACTKTDLTQISKILSLGLVGFVLVSLVFAIVSLFVYMPLFYLLICYIGLLMFVGLTVVDAQTIRKVSQTVGNNGDLSYKLSLILALKMYCNVIMVFWYLLQIFSSSGRRN
ncbi:Inner membrane protein YbhL [Chlamydia avium]|nr:Bax inhibitor-1/YccA family protein [Chlamydia avium]EPP37869.1 inhibitor of apoptosis-promoting Bax1 family protein [Chlamydia psittaci 10_743_SC13]EPP38122.1 inhibitor of apoptosis-promoting Bax1 family protein [Chlamydia avium]VVT43020.1 Inner membrane protein YbhL [Chlamydia avium]